MRSRLAALIAACGGAVAPAHQAAPVPTQPNIAMWSAPGTLNPLQATSATDPAVRKAAYGTLQVELQKQEPYEFLYEADGLWAYSTPVGGTAIPDAYGRQAPWLWPVHS